MRQALTGALVAATMLTAAGFAYNSQQRGAITPQQFNALKSRVTKLEGSNRALLGYTANCLLHWQGISAYGQPPNNGYVYDADNNPSNGQLLTTALDYTLSSSQPQGTS
jgi:hypothetical protein